MEANGFELAWIVVNDVKASIEFYTKVVGLKLLEFHEEMGWAELSGKKGGARLGIAQKQSCEESCGHPGQNAVMTFTVDNLEKAVAHLVEKKAKLVGDIQVVPGHVKMQTLTDTDGNQLQLVEVLYAHQGCCAGH